MWTRQRYFVRKKDIQAMTIKQSIWMKARGVAHLEVHIRKGNSDQTVNSRYMAVDLAKQIMTWYQPLPSVPQEGKRQSCCLIVSSTPHQNQKPRIHSTCLASFLS